MIRQARRAALRPKAHLAACRTCPAEANCPHSSHYTQSGACAHVAHACAGFRATDYSKVDAAIRKKNAQTFYGSKHERLALTDVELTMARGQSDVVELERQVIFRLGVRGMVYIADAVGTLAPGGRYTSRIYEPKGQKSMIYLLKRRIVELAYPEVEFFEVNQ